MIEPVKSRGSITGYKFEPWLKTSHEDLFVINLDDVLTMSESENLEMIMNYQEYIRKSTKGNFQKLDRKMGYISNVHDAKEVLEKLYNL